MKENTIPEKTTQQVPDTREQSRTLMPPVDIFETKEGLAVVADLPGVEKQEVQIDVDKGVLSIKATPKSLLPGDAVQREYALMNYFRQFQLSDAVDQEKIHAEMKYGVLTVHLPRVAEKQPRKIEVQVGA
jgi:HSP20 family protein